MLKKASTMTAALAVIELSCALGKGRVRAMASTSRCWET
jgi:hypothetical protein